MIAQYERAKIRERSSVAGGNTPRAAVQLASSLERPYGYRYLSKADGDGRAEYVVMIEEARVVRQIFEWVGLRGCSLGAVMGPITAGNPTRTGPRWDRGTLAAALANPAYKGTAGFGKTQQSVERKNRLRPRLGQSEFPRHDKGVCKTPPEQWDLIPVPAAHRWGDIRGRPGATGPQPRAPRSTSGCGALSVARTGGLLLLRSLLRQALWRQARSQRQSYSYYRCCGGDSYRFGGQRMCSNRAVRSDRPMPQLGGCLCVALEPGASRHEYRRRLENEPSSR